MSRDRGAATLFGAVVLGLVVWLGLGSVTLVGAVGDRIALETAADAAALAAVGAASTGGDPVQAASRMASSNGAILTRCECPTRGRAEIVATAWVVREVRLPFVGARTIRAVASAEYAASQS